MCRRFDSGSRHQSICKWAVMIDPPRRGSPWSQFIDGLAYRFAVQMVAIALALGVLTTLAPGVVALASDGRLEWLLTLIAFAAVLTATNVILRPLIYLLFGPLACLLILVTFGFFHFVLGALLLLWASEAIPGVSVAGFGAALFTSLVTSLAATLANSYFIKDKTVQVRIFRPGPDQGDRDFGGDQE